MTLYQEKRRDFTAQLEFDILMLRSHFAKWRKERLPGVRGEHRRQVRQRIIGVRHCRAMLEKLDEWEGV